jgi:multiple sugar transport system substrate-binding protein
VVSGVLAAGLVVSCGGVGGGGDNGDGDASGGGEVSGSIDTLGFSTEDVIAKSRVKAVEEAYPELDIKIASGGFDEQQFLTAVASGDPPSLVYLPRSDLGTYAARDALEPLDDCVEQQDIDMGTYRDAAVAQVTYDGSVYGIPEFNSVRILLSNTEALSEAGLSAEGIDVADWQALDTVTSELSRVSGSDIERIGFDPKIPEFFPLWVAANGGQIMSEDGLTAYLDSPEAVEALEYTVGLVEKTARWAEFKAFRDSWDFFGDQNQFVSDQVGAFPMEDWYLDVLADVSPDAPVTASAFQTRSGEPLTYATGNAWAIPKGAPNREAACAFAATMTSTETWVRAAQASKADRAKSGGEYLGTWTANEEADDQIFTEIYEPSGVESLDRAVEVVQSVQDVAISDPPSPAAAEVKKAWEDAVLRALEGDQTPAEALAQAQQEATEAIEQATS